MFLLRWSLAQITKRVHEGIELSIFFITRRGGDEVQGKIVLLCTLPNSLVKVNAWCYSQTKN